MKRCFGLLTIALVALLSPLCQAQVFAHPVLDADGSWNRIDVEYDDQTGSPFPVAVEKWDPAVDDDDGDGQPDEDEWQPLQEASCPDTEEQWKWLRPSGTDPDARIELGDAPTDGLKIRVKSSRQLGTPTPGVEQETDERSGPAPCDPV